MRKFLKRARLPLAGLLVAGLALPVLASFFTTLHWTVDWVALFLKPALIGLFLVGLALAALVRWFKAGRKVAGLTALAFAPCALGFPLLGGSASLSPEQVARALTVYQHNVWAGNLDGAAIAGQIRALDPDVAVLIETSQYYGTGSHFDALADTWPYQLKDTPRPARQARLRILSKYPVSDTQIFRDEATSMSLVVARVKAEFGPVTVMGLHFTRPWPFDWPKKQMEQLAVAMPVLEEYDCPCLVVGDFNSPPWGRLARTLEARFDLHHLPLGWRGTWHEALPEFISIPIDLSFASQDLEFGDATVLPAAGSDHRAVMFEIAPTAERQVLQPR
ncbi:MAG: endonuclease/exonuclease/phosphatase family protein [Hyphomonadaceae bacterium]|nr:endonuclease/exonuclease/phosphatase family protein [Hyphomonadaceae bacterium]